MKIEAKKSLGQRFLFNQVYLDQIIKCALKDYDDINELRMILEIGPGLGTLTDKISRAATADIKVICVEKDRDLHCKLVNRWNNVECLLDDALELDLTKVAGKPEQTVLIANLPYNISAPLIVKFLEKILILILLYLLKQIIFLNEITLYLI